MVHIGCPRVQGNLAVSRAIGDIHLKRYVIGKAEIQQMELQEGDRLVLASGMNATEMLCNERVSLKISRFVAKFGL